MNSILDGGKYMEENREDLESRGPRVGTAIVKKMFREVLRVKITSKWSSQIGNRANHMPSCLS